MGNVSDEEFRKLWATDQAKNLERAFCALLDSKKVPRRVDHLAKLMMLVEEIVDAQE